jgi:hypothetical protein
LVLGAADHDPDEHARLGLAGFSFNYQRCSWIREFVQDAAQVTAALETAIKKAGFDLASA